jgi:hypothetical protein
VNQKAVYRNVQIGAGLADPGRVGRPNYRPADDLRRDFPEISGLSTRDLKYMRAFAEAHTDPEIVQQVVAQLSWGLRPHEKH